MYFIILYVWIAAAHEFAEIELDYKYVGPAALAECEASREEITPRAMERVGEQYGPGLYYVAGVCAMDAEGDA